MTQFTDLNKLTPAQYSRFQEAAKLRAHMLRQEAIAQFWSDVGHALAKWLHAPSVTRKTKHANPSLA